MQSVPAPWVHRAWQHWHRPWAIAHASWLDEAHGAGGTGPAKELALRLHYPAWCAAHGLEPTLLDFADTVWWRLLALAPARFEQVAARVGLTLRFAADRRLRLLRGATATDVEATRWALARADFVPEPVAVAVREAAPAADAGERAALSLRWCLDETAPALAARLRLRLPRVQAARAAFDHEGRPGDPQVRAHLGRLWHTALRNTHHEEVAA